MNTTYAKNKRIRTALLELLRTEYPSGLDMRALQFALDNLGYPMPEARIEAHLSYLEEKGLVKAASRRGAGVTLKFASLTAEGWDYLDKEQGA